MKRQEAEELKVFRTDLKMTEGQLFHLRYGPLDLYIENLLGEGTNSAQLIVFVKLCAAPRRRVLAALQILVHLRQPNMRHCSLRSDGGKLLRSSSLG